MAREGEMGHNLVDTFNELRSQPAVLHTTVDGLGIADLAFRSKTLVAVGQGTDSQGQENVAEEKVFWSKYDQALAELRKVWGQPDYDGPGWREGYKDACPSPDEFFWQLYSKALRIAWWKRDGFVHAVMVTGHDANTLQKLRLAVAEAGPLGHPTSATRTLQR
jgi:hypothetical protein